MPESLLFGAHVSQDNPFNDWAVLPSFNSGVVRLETGALGARLAIGFCNGQHQISAIHGSGRSRTPIRSVLYWKGLRPDAAHPAIKNLQKMKI
jgi:hypothetical protein